MPEHQLILCIVNYGDATKTMKLSEKYGIKAGFVLHGQGTVSTGRLMNFLGLNEIRKEIVCMITENEKASAALKGISKDMMFHKPHHGIAFSHFIAEQNEAGKAKDKSTGNGVKDIMYSAIYTVVDRGKAEDVIEASSKAGAKGGTIINARGAGAHEVKRLFSLDIEPEKEVVLILTEKELTKSISDAIKEILDIDQPGNGIMFVLDVGEAYGLRKE